MDRNTIGNEIEAEINASYRYKNLRELIDILLSVIILKTGKKELVGIEERLYVSLGKIFDGETTINDIKLCLSNVIKIEPLLKKMILLIDEDEYDKIVQENLGLAHVITQLGLNPDNKKLDRKPEDYLCDGNYMEHVARSYALRNSESHTYVGWTRREIYTNLDSVLITCLRAVEINKKAYKTFEDKGKIGLVIQVENYEVYALTWDDVFKSFELRHAPLLKRLNYDREKLAKELMKEIENEEGRDKVNALTNIAIGKIGDVS